MAQGAPCHLSPHLFEISSHASPRSLFPPRWPPAAPQGLCLGCSLCLEHSSRRDPRGSLFQVFAETPPSHRGLPLAAGSPRQPPSLLSCCPTQQFLTLSTRWLFPLPFDSHLLPPTNSGLFGLWPATVCLVLRAALAHPVLKKYLLVVGRAWQMLTCSQPGSWLPAADRTPPAGLIPGCCCPCSGHLGWDGWGSGGFGLTHGNPILLPLFLIVSDQQTVSLCRR